MGCVVWALVARLPKLFCIFTLDVRLMIKTCDNIEQSSFHAEDNLNARENTLLNFEVKQFFILITYSFFEIRK